MFAALLMMATPAVADPVVVPSGLDLTFVDVIKDVPGNRGLTWRYRFMAPTITREQTGSVATDFDTICANFVLPDLAGVDPIPQQIVISISDRAVDFGVANPDAIQFFEAYRIDDKTCVWEGF